MQNFNDKPDMSWQDNGKESTSKPEKEKEKTEKCICK